MMNLLALRVTRVVNEKEKKKSETVVFRVKCSVGVCSFKRNVENSAFNGFEKKNKKGGGGRAAGVICK